MERYVFSILFLILALSFLSLAIISGQFESLADFIGKLTSSHGAGLP